MKTHHKLGMLGALYVSQGLPFGLFTQALPAVLRQQGVSLAVIGLSSLLALPWGLKALWAPWVDRGPRRRWLVPLQLAAAAVLLALAFADPQRALVWLVVGVVLTNTLAATQDIATDGLAVDLLTPAERGLGNGVQVAAYRVGMIVGGGALLVAFERIGWSSTFLLAAGILLLATVPLAWLREPHRAPSQPGGEGLAPALRRFWAEPSLRAWLGVLVLYKAGDHLASSMLRPYLVDGGAGLAELGVLLGTVGFGAGLLGALLGGLAVQRFGSGRALVQLGVLQALSLACYCLAPPTLGLGIYAAVVFEHLATGMATAALFAAMMGRCRPAHAGTDYTLQASVVVLASGGAAALGGMLAQGLGYTATFGLGALLSALAVLWLARVERQPLSAAGGQSLEAERAARGRGRPSALSTFQNSGQSGICTNVGSTWS